MLVLPHAVGAYVLGCAPTGRFARRAVGDVPWAGAAHVLVDAAKGYLAVALLSPELTLGQALAATAVIAGHQWPAFWGAPGKEPGAAVLVGALAAITPLAAPLWAVAWGLTFVVTGYVQAGGLIATALILPAICLSAGWPFALLALPATGMVLERQRVGWGRWWRGEDPKYLWRGGA